MVGGKQTAGLRVEGSLGVHPLSTQKCKALKTGLWNICIKNKSMLALDYAQETMRWKQDCPILGYANSEKFLLIFEMTLSKYRNLKCIKILVKVASRTAFTLRISLYLKVVVYHGEAAPLRWGQLPELSAKWRTPFPSRASFSLTYLEILHGGRDITEKLNLDQDGRSHHWAISYHDNLSRYTLLSQKNGAQKDW